MYLQNNNDCIQLYAKLQKCVSQLSSLCITFLECVIKVFLQAAWGQSWRQHHENKDTWAPTESGMQEFGTTKLYHLLRRI